MPVESEMSYAEYRARLRGIGIEDPEACNDENVDVVDKHELFGWKGMYRLHVARMFRLVSASGGPHYQLDALPPTPRQWLESDDAAVAPGPPLAPQTVQDDDAAMLQAASLDQATQAIAGGDAELADAVRAALVRLLEAERAHAAANPATAWLVPWAFDFDALAPSQVVPR